MRIRFTTPQMELLEMEIESLADETNAWARSWYDKIREKVRARWLDLNEEDITKWDAIIRHSMIAGVLNCKCQGERTFGCACECAITGKVLGNILTKLTQKNGA